MGNKATRRKRDSCSIEMPFLVICGNQNVNDLGRPKSSPVEPPFLSGPHQGPVVRRQREPWKKIAGFIEAWKAHCGGRPGLLATVAGPPAGRPADRSRPACNWLAVNLNGTAAVRLPLSLPEAKRCVPQYVPFPTQPIDRPVLTPSR